MLLARCPISGLLRTASASSARAYAVGFAPIFPSAPEFATPEKPPPLNNVVEPEAYEVAERRRLVVSNIAERIEDPTRRLFAVIFINRKQFKVIQDDVIHLEHNVPLDVGEEIKLEKVLIVGGADFTLIGRPLLDPKHVHVHATVIEKTTTSPEVKYNYKIQTIDNPLWMSHELTVLRINNIFLEKALLGEP